MKKRIIHLQIPKNRIDVAKVKSPKTSKANITVLHTESPTDSQNEDEEEAP